MRSPGLVATTVLLASGAAAAQPAPIAAASATPETAQVTTPGENAWTYYLSAYTYFVPDAADYVQPTFTADRGSLRVEARYNYENQRTGSAWIGRNFSAGDKLAVEFTPIFGGVFGDTTGIAAGYQGSLSWWKLELYSESEYVFGTTDRSASFIYNWSELSLSPVEWFRFGIATQRTRAYKADRDIQPGLLVGFSYRKSSLSAFVFNPDSPKPLAVLALEVKF